MNNKNKYTKYELVWNKNITRVILNLHKPFEGELICGTSHWYFVEEEKEEEKIKDIVCAIGEQKWISIGNGSEMKKVNFRSYYLTPPPHPHSQPLVTFLRRTIGIGKCVNRFALIYFVLRRWFHWKLSESQAFQTRT